MARYAGHFFKDEEMHLIFFDIDDTLCVDPGAESWLEDHQKTGLHFTEIPLRCHDFLPLGFKKKDQVPMIHWDMHKDIFSFLEKHQFLFKTYLITTGNSNKSGFFVDFLNEAYKPIKLFTPDFFYDLEKVKTDFMARRKIPEKDIYKYRITKDETIAKLATEHHLPPQQCWLIDDSDTQRIEAFKHGFKTFDSTSGEYPNNLMLALEEAKSSGYQTEV